MAIPTLPYPSLLEQEAYLAEASCRHEVKCLFQGLGRRSRFLLQPGSIVIATAILLPAALFGLAAWESYGIAIREVDERAERSARIVEEHALKVFETHRLVIQVVYGRLGALGERADDPTALHQLLAALQGELDQVATITITDAEGRMRASGRVVPPDPKLDFSDRDWLKAPRAADLPLVHRSTNEGTGVHRREPDTEYDRSVQRHCRPYNRPRVFREVLSRDRNHFRSKCDPGEG